MTFDDAPDRRLTPSSKWDMLDGHFGIPRDEGLAMWIADSDYPSPPCVRKVVRKAAEMGFFGYGYDEAAFHAAIAWWMQTRHGWSIDTDWILTTQGLGNAIAVILDVFSAPGEGVAYFTPVYHEFRNKTEKAGRRPVPLPLAREGDTYVLDLEEAQKHLTGDERVLLWCSPQNPSGRVWTPEELRAVADFAADNELILVSDEVHHDLLYPGASFVPMDIAAPEHRNRLIVATAASKTFNLAGQRTGNLIIPDPDLRAAIAGRLRALDYSPNVLGVHMVTAAYSPEGAAWADAQMVHLDRNRRTFDAGIAEIPGLWSMPLQSTYLAWVDFSGTGMDQSEVDDRLKTRAKIAVSDGPGFGPGGETFHRFNFAMPHAMVEDCIARLKHAFSDLQ